jgi:hypothetical protein
MPAAIAARRMADRDRDLAALAAGIYFVAMPTIMLKARVGETDTIVTVLVGIALLIWSARRRDRPLDIAAYCGVSLALAAVILAKGPVPALFALLPMIVAPALDRKGRDVAAACVAFAVAMIPVGIWLWLNRDVITAAHLAAEMRVQSRDLGGFIPNAFDFCAAALELLPALALAILWWKQRSLTPEEAAQKRWLFLAAVPIAALVSLWPSGRARYAMPAAWPIAVAGGLATARWSIRSRPGIIALIATTVAALIVAMVLDFGVDGHTRGQSAMRANIAALNQSLAALPAGAVTMFFDDRDERYYNLLAYADRPIIETAAPDAPCRPAPGLLTTADFEGPVLASGRWGTAAPFGTAGLLLFRPIQSSGTCSTTSRAPA